MCKYLPWWIVVLARKKFMCKILSYWIFRLQRNSLLLDPMSKPLLWRSFHQILCWQLSFESTTLRWWYEQIMCFCMSWPFLCGQKICNLYWLMSRCHRIWNSDLRSRLQQCLCLGMCPTLLCLSSNKNMCEQVSRSILQQYYRSQVSSLSSIMFFMFFSDYVYFLYINLLSWGRCLCSRMLNQLLC